MDSFTPVWFHRLRYMLTPQLDLYKNIARTYGPGEVLDMGCGNGFGTIQLLPSVVHGVDIDKNAIEFARSTLGHLAHFDVSRPEKMWRSGYDLITCIEVIEHVDNVDKFLYNLKEIAPKATFIFSTLNHNSQHRKNDAHIGKWTVHTFRWLMQEYFGKVRLTDYLLQDQLEDDSTLTPMVAVCQI